METYLDVNLNIQATQLHLHLDMHFLQSESVGFPPLQSQRLIHFDLEVPPHKHRAMQRTSGTHDGQPYFIWSKMQVLHPLRSDGHAKAGEDIDHNISSITKPRAKGPLLHCQTFLDFLVVSIFPMKIKHKPTSGKSESLIRSALDIDRYEVVQLFNKPYLATSLQDFWGRRWNRYSSNILRETVYNPTRNMLNGIVGVATARILALICSLVVSGVLHEMLFYYITCGKKPTWEVTCYFVLQGLAMALEAAVKKLDLCRHMMHGIKATPTGGDLCRHMMHRLKDTTAGGGLCRHMMHGLKATPAGGAHICVKKKIDEKYIVIVGELYKSVIREDVVDDQRGDEEPTG
ncbi:hypothetical protein COLO4_31880 [Corchorus olitorius]|uniref:Wax synthase domain-containing protein n=1 Tax=Corchorus olitorius TaxID=93759 RepID=A0A1R3H314_9ROSI|nr:hypothetical protein COLO4_31880 [Corchorus olitorius]